MGTRCPKCSGEVVRNHDEAGCINCGWQVIIPARASDIGGDQCLADRDGNPALSMLSRRQPGMPRSRTVSGEFMSDGCKVWHRCLTCPLPKCIYEGS